MYNATEGNVTGIRVSGADSTAELQVNLTAGTEEHFVLPFVPDTVRAFSGEAEVCVFTAEK